MLEIRKYNGRKYYCEGKYIRLQDISELVYNGTEFYVIKHDTNEDITQKILSDVLYNERKIQNRYNAIDNIKQEIVKLVARKKMYRMMKTDTSELPRGIE